MGNNALVAVRTYVNQFEAEVDKTALDAAGIESMIRSDDCGGLRPHLWLGGVELLVRDEDAAQAREILDTPPVTTPEA
ncbi:MAG: putative signal transducing protein [Vicinamibacterales bacterium]